GVTGGTTTARGGGGGTTFSGGSGSASGRTAGTVSAGITVTPPGPTRTSDGEVTTICPPKGPRTTTSPEAAEARTAPVPRVKAQVTYRRIGEFLAGGRGRWKGLFYLAPFRGVDKSPGPVPCSSGTTRGRPAFRRRRFARIRRRSPYNNGFFNSRVEDGSHDR